MFVIYCLAHVLANSCKEVVMGVKYDDFRVYTELTRSSM